MCPLQSRRGPCLCSHAGMLQSLAVGGLNVHGLYHEQVPPHLPGLASCSCRLRDLVSTAHREQLPRCVSCLVQLLLTSLQLPYQRNIPVQARKGSPPALAGRAGIQLLLRREKRCKILLEISYEILTTTHIPAATIPRNLRADLLTRQCQEPACWLLERAGRLSS